MENKVEYKSDKQRWKEYTVLTPEKLKQLIEGKVKRATLLAESDKRLIKS